MVEGVGHHAGERERRGVARQPAQRPAVGERHIGRQAPTVPLRLVQRNLGEATEAEHGVAHHGHPAEPVEEGGLETLLRRTDHGVGHHDPGHARRAVCKRAQQRGAAPILPDEHDAIDVEGVGERTQDLAVPAQGVEAGRHARAQPEPNQVRADPPHTLQRLDHLPPQEAPRRVAMLEPHRAPVGVAPLHDVNGHPLHLHHAAPCARREEAGDTVGQRRSVGHGASRRAVAGALRARTRP